MRTQRKLPAALSVVLPDFALICADFALLEETDDRYAYLLDLGRALPGIPEDARSDDWLVRGCMSRVWMHRGAHGIEADSDALMVRGLLAILLSAAAAGVAADVADLLSRTRLQGLISMQRSNGLAAAAERLRAL